MASERFLKLDKEKQERILTAAREEFSSVPFDEVSINRIIRSVGISRGSFYTYFEDKEDLLGYICEEQDISMERSLREKLLAEDGNLWTALMLWTREVLGYMEQPAVRQFIGILSNIHLARRQEIQARSSAQKQLRDREQFEWFLQNVNPKTLDLRRPREELRVLYQTVLRLALIALASEAVKIQSREQILHELELQLNILRRGINIDMEGEGRKTI